MKNKQSFRWPKLANSHYVCLFTHKGSTFICFIVLDHKRSKEKTNKGVDLTWRTVSGKQWQILHNVGLFIYLLEDIDNHILKKNRLISS